MELPAELPPLNLTGDALDTLTVPELRVINARLSREAGASVDAYDAITRPTAQRWDALALVAWCHAKRATPTARADAFLELTAAQLVTITAWTPPEPADDDDGDDAPTAAEQQAELDAAVAADPTDPTR